MDKILKELESNLLKLSKVKFPEFLGILLVDNSIKIVVSDKKECIPTHIETWGTFDEEGFYYMNDDDENILIHDFGIGNSLDEAIMDYYNKKI